MSALSPERHGRITASRVPAILGVSRYQTREDALREAIREHYGLETFDGNWATDQGHRLEAFALDRYQHQTGNLVDFRGDEQRFFVHPVHGWLGATPDGVVAPVPQQPDGAVEAKFCGAAYVHWRQRPDFEAQGRMQIACVDAAWCDVVMYHVDGLPWISRIERDKDWLATVLPTLRAFHDEVRRHTEGDRPPDQFLALDPKARADDEWRLAAMDFLDRQADVDDAEQALDAARTRLVELAGGKSAKGCGVSVSVSTRKGATDWKAAAGVYLPDDADLSKFKRADVPVITVRGVKG